MKQLPTFLLADLRASILATFDKEMLDDFTSLRTDIYKLKFTDAIPSNLNLEQSITKYVEVLNKEGKVNTFFEACWNEKEGFKEDENAKSFKKRFDDIYTKTPEEILKLKEDLFQCNLMQDDRLAFIGRSQLQKYLYDLIHDKNNTYLLLTGPSKSGLTYIKNYLIEISKRLDAFPDFQYKVIYINFKDIFVRIKESVRLVHLAQEMSLRLSTFGFTFDLSKLADFKEGEFIQVLLPFLYRSEVKFLFFFDQFDAPHSKEISDFIKILIDQLYSNATENYYIILAGFKTWDDWSYEMRTAIEANPIVLQSFKRQEVIEFLRKIHFRFSVKYKDVYTLQFSEETMIETVEESEPVFLDDALFNSTSDTLPNVTTIGREVDAWLREFQQIIKKPEE